MKINYPVRHTGLVLRPMRFKKLHLISECLKTHVPFVDRALSEIPETKTDSFRYGHAVQVHAVAVRFGVIQKRARFFSSVPIRCPCSESRHDHHRRCRSIYINFPLHVGKIAWGLAKNLLM